MFDPYRSSPFSPALRPLTLGLTLVVAATAFEALAVATVLPAALRDLGGLALYGWTFSAFMLANLVGISIGGTESDRIGPAPSFAAGMALFVAGLAASGFAPSMLVIVIGRALQGLGAGVLSSVAYASIARLYPPAAQLHMLATFSAAWVIPGVVGPTLAAVIGTYAGWRWIFLGFIPPLVVASALAIPSLRRIPKVAPPANRAREISRAAQLGIGASAALAGLGPHSWPLKLALIAGGCALAVRALRELTPPGTLVARPGSPASIACLTLITFSFFGTEAFLPLALAEVRNAPLLLSGGALTGAAFTWTLGAWLPVQLGRMRRRAIVRFGLALLGAGIAATSAVLHPLVPAGFALVAWALAGLGMGLAFTTTSAAVLETDGKDQTGIAAASLPFAQILGTALATGAGGAIIAAPFAGDPPSRGIGLIHLAMLGTTLVAAAAARGIPDSSRRTSDDTEPQPCTRTPKVVSR